MMNFRMLELLVIVHVGSLDELANFEGKSHTQFNTWGLCQKECISTAKNRKTNETNNKKQSEIFGDSKAFYSLMHEGQEKGDYICY
jgi:hypothetical protein